MRSCQQLGGKVLVVAIAAIGSKLSIAGSPDSPEDLGRQLEALRAQVIELDRKQQTALREQSDAAKTVVTAGATKGSFKLPGSDTSVTLGGYVKLDAVFSNPSAGVGSTADLFLQPNAIPVGPGNSDNERNQVKFGARESRMFAKTSTPTAWGDLVTYVEGDFYGADGNESVSNSSGLRIRHAYGSLGPLLGGQTWTNFMYVPALPETLDFGGPVGQIFDRQAQVRWTQPFDATGSIASGRWSVALENPESVVTVPGGASFRADDDHFPDITGQIQFDTSTGRIAVSALLRQIRADSKTPAVVDQSMGGALSVAGVIPTLGKDDVRFTLSAGNAIGRYANGFFPDAIVGTDGRARLARQWGWYGAYRHFWNDSLRSNVVLSSASASNPAGTSGSTNRSTQSAHVNLIWSPVANTDLGVEYIVANRRTEDDASGHLNRLQASAKYTF
jgi:hypothetical protein